MLGGPPTRSGFPPPSGRVTPPRYGLVLLRRSQEGFRPVRTIQAEVVTGGSTARIDQVRSPAEVDLIHETVERSRASLQYTASLRLIAVETDLRGQLADLLV